MFPDIIFLKAWVKLDIPKFIMPVTSLLLKRDSKELWCGMKTIGTLRHERGLAVPQKQDSLYKVSFVFLKKDTVFSATKI